MTSTRVRTIMAVAETGDRTLFVEHTSEAGEPEQAVSSVYARETRGPDAGVPRQVLATNEQLSCLWVSPSGAAWVASVSGHVATNAPVAWRVGPRASYTGKDEAPWVATALPPVRRTGVPPNVSALGGTGDGQVFAGTATGDVYGWNGEAWVQQWEGAGHGAAIKAFAGVAGDVFAAGASGLLHFDGARWREREVPDAPPGEVLTGAQRCPDGTTLFSASAREGRLLRATSDGLSEWGRTPLQLVDLVCIGGRALLATDGGVAELFEREVRLIKTNFQAVSAWPGHSRVFFVEPEQPVAAFIEHDPEGARPWFRRKH